MSSEEEIKEKVKAKEKDTEWDGTMIKIKGCCGSKVMRIANLVACFLLILTAFIKFSYMETGFNMFFMLHTINQIALIVLLAIAE